MAPRARPPAPPSLFEAARSRAPASGAPGGDAPLADRLRPRSLDEIVGQRHLLGPGKVLARAIAEDRVPPLILWGPPGSGKTTLARVIAAQTKGRFVPYSAVNGSVPELRGLLAEASEARLFRGERTLLFVDEIHRFNKAQQDALLPDVEKGTAVLVGATTENPSFAVNAALLSRCRVFRLEAVPEADLVGLLRRALADAERGLGALGLAADDEALAAIAQASAGDARRALGTLELVVAHARAARPDLARLTRAEFDALGEHRPLLYDKAGEEHYNVASALIKSLRGGDPDAALYWLFRMMEAGDDPLFLSRRLVIFASEDVGNADPRALEVAVAADAAYRRLGLPEGAYPLAHACLYLACAPKSDGVKRAMKRVRQAIEASGPLPVPMKLRNAPTRLMRAEGYGEGYRDPHAHEGHVAPGETYLPDALAGVTFYEPTEQGFERRLREILAARRAARAPAPGGAPPENAPRAPTEGPVERGPSPPAKRGEAATGDAHQGGPDAAAGGGAARAEGRGEALPGAVDDAREATGHGGARGEPTEP
jgi:putative ATPase